MSKALFRLKRSLSSNHVVMVMTHDGKECETPSRPVADLHWSQVVCSLRQIRTSDGMCHHWVTPTACLWFVKDKLHFDFHQEAFEFLFTFCHKGGVICISEVIDISPSNLDSSYVSSSPAFLMMYSAYKLNKQGDNIQPWRTPFRFGTSLLFHVQF